MPGCHCRVPLQGAIVACFGGDGGPTLADWTWCLGAIAGCHCWVHCRVPLWRALVLMVGQLWQIGRGAWVPLQGAIAGCHCSSLWWGRRWWANFGGVDKAPGWHCRAPLWRALVVMVGQLWQIGRGIGAVAGCHCLVLWWGGDVAPGCHCTTVGGDDGGPTLADWTWHQGAIVAGYGGDGVPTLANQGAVAGCHCHVLRWGRCESGETAWS